MSISLIATGTASTSWTPAMVHQCFMLMLNMHTADHAHQALQRSVLTQARQQSCDVSALMDRRVPLYSGGGKPFADQVWPVPIGPAAMTRICRWLTCFLGSQDATPNSNMACLEQNVKHHRSVGDLDASQCLTPNPACRCLVVPNQVVIC